MKKIQIVLCEFALSERERALLEYAATRLRTEGMSTLIWSDDDTSLCVQASSAWTRVGKFHRVEYVAWISNAEGERWIEVHYALGPMVLVMSPDDQVSEGLYDLLDMLRSRRPEASVIRNS